MIRYANETDYDIIGTYDKHISKSELRSAINSSRVLCLFDNGVFLGWLRFNLFWDNIPFMNMLFILEKYRGKGYGKQLVDYWENEMREKNYQIVLTSTLSSEQAQFFYRKAGYIDCGSLLLPGEPLEIILQKCLE